MIVRTSGVRRFGNAAQDAADAATAAAGGSVSPEGCPEKGSWEAWCDCKFPADKAVNARCKAKGWNVVAMAHPPWDMAGAQARNIPFTGKETTEGWVGLVGAKLLDPLNIFGIKSDTKGAATGLLGAQYQATQSQGIFGLPTMVIGIAGGVIALGILGAALVARSRRSQ